MQLLVHHQIEDYDAWREAFDDDSEDRTQAGLSLMQIWREDGAAAVWLLYEVHDRDRARAISTASPRSTPARAACAPPTCTS